ncbi:MAG: LapA family protein [Burkholderiales bacterium]|nr:LapA family protein [Burkholderiales bacterium]MDE2453019.1 LapA family protein [Burkholderiales bacterium]
MNLRTLTLAASLALLVVFTLLNWSAFTAPTALSLGFATVQAPLGLVMLVVTGAVCTLFLVYIVLQQARLIVETRRSAKEVKSHRELADKAEASRFTELQETLLREVRRLDEQAAARSREVVGRLDALEKQLGQRFDEAARTLSACVGEVDDKLDRLQLPPPR